MSILLLYKLQQCDPPVYLPHNWWLAFDIGHTYHMLEYVVLVDDNGNEVGIGEKLRTHEEGKLHRAFSVFVFNSDGELLLQRRARTKYHSGGLWTNTCCSHPRPGEPRDQAAYRRLKEEMGFDCELREIFSFIYRTRLDNNLFEHEYDHVFIGIHDGDPTPNSEEVESWRWMALDVLKRDVQKNPEAYTYWFKTSIDRVIATYQEQRSP